jgi:hypothetical protein
MLSPEIRGGHTLSKIKNKYFTQRECLFRNLGENILLQKSFAADESWEPLLEAVHISRTQHQPTANPPAA